MPKIQKEGSGFGVGPETTLFIQAQADCAEQAIQLYHGEYFPNLYHDWLMPERRRLSQAYLGALRALAEHHYAHLRYTHALELLQRALRVDSLLEDLHCQSIRVYAALGVRVDLDHFNEISKNAY
jgi:two-component SAPR family response regulator